MNPVASTFLLLSPCTLLFVVASGYRQANRRITTQFKTKYRAALEKCDWEPGALFTHLELTEFEKQIVRELMAERHEAELRRK